MRKSEFSKSTLNRFGRLLVSGLLCLAVAVVLNISVIAQGVKPSATFEKVWVDYDITESGRKGLRVHLKFNVRGLKGVDSAIRIYFETGDGKRLRDNNKSYYTVGGDVALFRNLKIDYDPGYYEDLVLFMPYSELDLSGGEYDLKMDVDLIYKNGDLVQHLTYYDFVFTQPETTTPTTAPLPDPIDDTDSDQKASVEKVWIDYDVVQGGKKGMRIHVNFTVRGLKGIDSYLAIYFERKNGDKLTTTNTNFASKDGQLAIYKSLKPGYEPTVYEDAQLFLPYEEIKIGKGVYDMKMDIDLIYKNGDLFQHLNFHDFVFRRQ